MQGAVCLLLLALPVLAQDYAVASLSRHILTNENIITLAKAGFDELFIVERIRSSRTRFDMSVQGLVSLKEAGVTEDLIGVMALQDRRNRVAALSATDAALLEAVPANAEQPARVRVEKHWWGFRWVRVYP